MKLTLDQFEHLVLKLANQTPTRYFKHWNHPQTDPWLMAVVVDLRRLAFHAVERLRQELRERGIQMRAVRDGMGFHVFTVERDVEGERNGG